MIIQPMKESDLDEIDFTELKAMEKVIGAAAKDIIAAKATSSIAYTLFNDKDKVIMIAGVTKVWGNFYEIWILTSPLFTGYSKTVIKVCKQLINQMKHIGYDRIQADIQTSIVANARFAEFFGFKKEADMPNYGLNKEMYTRYALYGDA